MTRKRFPWSRVTNLEALRELQSRNIKHPVEKPNGLKCIAEKCRKTIKVDDECYFPTYNPGPDNVVIAHVKCTDETLAASAKEAKLAGYKKLESKGIMPAADPKPVVPGVDVKAYIQKIREAAFEEGRRLGRQETLAELAAALGEDEGQELGH